MHRLIATQDRADLPGSPLGGALTGADALFAALRAWGYSTVFAYPGTSELTLCSAIERTRELMLVNARGDREAAFMAAGGNLFGGKVSVALLHGARDLTNALGAIVDVRRNEVSVL